MTTTDAQQERADLFQMIESLKWTHEKPPLGVYREWVHAPEVLNEATAYGSTFPRAITLQIEDYVIMEISGTASVNEHGKTAYPGDFEAQAWRTFRNITVLLRQKRFSWGNVMRTRCYLRDIDRDYAEFNRIRSAFYDVLGLRPPPASVGIQAVLCRPDLLVEIEATAIRRKEDGDLPL